MWGTNKQGFTLTGTLVSAGIGMILMLGLISQIAFMNKASNSVSNKNALIGISTQTMGILTDPEMCGDALGVVDTVGYSNQKFDPAQTDPRSGSAQITVYVPKTNRAQVLIQKNSQITPSMTASAVAVLKRPNTNAINMGNGVNRYISDIYVIGAAKNQKDQVGGDVVQKIPMMVDINATKNIVACTAGSGGDDGTTILGYKLYPIPFNKGVYAFKKTMMVENLSRDDAKIFKDATILLQSNWDWRSYSDAWINPVAPVGFAPADYDKVVAKISISAYTNNNHTNRLYMQREIMDPATKTWKVEPGVPAIYLGDQFGISKRTNSPGTATMWTPFWNTRLANPIWGPPPYPVANQRLVVSGHSNWPLDAPKTTKLGIQYLEIELYAAKDVGAAAPTSFPEVTGDTPGVTTAGLYTGSTHPAVVASEKFYDSDPEQELVVEADKTGYGSWFQHMLWFQLYTDSGTGSPAIFAADPEWGGNWAARALRFVLSNYKYDSHMDYVMSISGKGTDGWGLYEVCIPSAANRTQLKFYVVKKWQSNNHWDLDWGQHRGFAMCMDDGHTDGGGIVRVTGRHIPGTSGKCSGQNAADMNYIKLTTDYPFWR